MILALLDRGNFQKIKKLVVENVGTAFDFFPSQPTLVVNQLFCVSSFSGAASSGLDATAASSPSPGRSEPGVP